MKTDLPIRDPENALDRLCIGGLVAPLKTQDGRMCAVDQLAHAGKAEFLSGSPISELHAPVVRKTHIVVNAAVAWRVHGIFWSGGTMKGWLKPPSRL